METNHDEPGSSIVPVKATFDDVEATLSWLEREYREDGEGFWSNRCMIRRSFTDGDLWVIHEGGEAVAFQVGDYGTYMVCVRKDRRCQGYGTALFESSLARAIEDGVTVLAGECSPPSSLPFWQKMGFERYGDTSPWAPITVRRVLHHEHHVRAQLPKTRVAISFWPEAASYNHSPDVLPFRVCELTGGRLDNGAIILSRRVIGFADDEPGRDLVVKIEVDGDTRCFCKAKHEEAMAVGVQRDRHGNTFYIDRVEPVEG